jgi:hypothetical protein
MPLSSISVVVFVTLTTNFTARNLMTIKDDNYHLKTNDSKILSLH